MASNIGDKVYGGVPTPLFALLIGIDKYKNPTDLFDLKGSVSDVKLFETYLESYLNTPSEHVTLLCNESATREAIIKSLKNLAEDARIQHNDAIIIYFSGHGSEINAPPGWECSDPRRRIQSILPYDFATEEPHVPPIPDRTINQLLASISKKHGKNITVIFDCCYSGSGTRNQHSASRDDSPRVRSIDLELVCYPDNLDEDILSGSHSGFKYCGLQSHILLAACGSKELAYEDKFTDGFGNSRYAGCFSAALLKLLHRVPPNQITYSNLLSLIDNIPRQNPQCEGINKNRPLFSVKIIPLSTRKSFNVSYHPGKDGHEGYYVIEAGKFHRITESTEFTIYYEHDLSLSRPLGVLRVVKLSEFQVTAQPTAVNGSKHFEISTGPAGKAIAIPTVLDYKEKLQVWIDPASQELQDLYHAVTHTQADKIQHVHLVAAEELAEIKLRLDEQKQIAIEIFSCSQVLPRLTPFKWQADGISPDIGTLSSILYRASNFYSELKRAHVTLQLIEGIGIEFLELKEQTEEDDDLGLKIVLRPKNGCNLFKDNVVHLTYQEYKVYYGLKLTNNTSVDLYVNMHMFMNSDLGIVPIFNTEGNAPYKLDVSLPALKTDLANSVPGTLAIGYGAAGHPPLSFKLRPNVHHDLDYLMIYLSTDPADTAYLNQPSIVQNANNRAVRPRTKTTASAWDCIVIPIIQQRVYNSA